MASWLQFVIFVFTCVIPLMRCANILVIFPHTGESHFLNTKPYLMELAQRGHNLTVISHFPLNSNEKLHIRNNYHDISLAGSVELDTNNVSMTLFESFGYHITSKTFSNLLALYMMGGASTEAAFKVDALNQFVNATLTTGHNFDLAIIETFNMDVFLGLVYRMKVPFISITTCALFPWSAERIAMPQNPSYIPTNSDIYDDKMNLLQRIKNTVSLISLQTVFKFMFLSRDQKVAYEKFGHDLPRLEDIAKNTSLILANVHFSLNKPRPNVPQLIEVGGIHIKPAKPLSQDLSNFLNESRHGVVYFCMGSLLRGESFPAEKRQAFLDAFSELRENVLWKYEGETLPGQPKNVKILPWMPQRDILAHPNVKLFITHGGLLGTIEAVYEGVPMLGIPMFGDQDINMNSIQSAGAGLVLDYQKDIHKEKILSSINALLTPKYAENAKRLKTQYLDRPMSPMETAMYWTEYVLRHKGAHHLRTAAVDMPWYEYFCVDVALILLAAILLCVYCNVLLLQFLMTRLFSRTAVKNKTD